MTTTVFKSDDAQRPIQGAGCLPHFFYHPNVAVFCDGSLHDKPHQKETDREICSKLVELGYRVVVTRYDREIEEQVRGYPEVFHAPSGKKG